MIDESDPSFEFTSCLIPYWLFIISFNFMTSLDTQISID